MTKQMKCPLCGTENERTYRTESVGLVEDYYQCKHCGYFFEMCYSEPHEGIDFNMAEKSYFKEIKAAITNTIPVGNGENYEVVQK